jgi:hypothetical protein
MNIDTDRQNMGIAYLGMMLFFVYYLLAWKDARRLWLQRNRVTPDDLGALAGSQFSFVFGGVQKLLYTVLFLIVVKQFLSFLGTTDDYADIQIIRLAEVLWIPGGILLAVILLSFLLTYGYVLTVRHHHLLLAGQDDALSQKELRITIDSILYFQLILMAALYPGLYLWVLRSAVTSNYLDVVR